MAKITRPTKNIRSFGDDAAATERTIFGDVTETDDLDLNLNSDFFRGWGILAPGAKPPKQYFNGAMFTVSQLISYLFQMGIPEWDTNQEFHTGSLTQVAGTIYQSLSDDNIGNDPTSDVVNWVQFLTDQFVVKDSDVGAASLPVGTVIQRPGVPEEGMLRRNSETGQFEGYTGAEWTGLGGATGGTGNPFTYLNDQSVSADYTFPADQNAMSAGPIEIEDGITVTIPDGATYTIV
jgi:hypothetical protein